MSIFDILLAFTTLFSLLLAADWLFNAHRIQFLKTDKLKPVENPRLSIIYSALNEEETIGAATAKLISLSYPNYEVIAVNDRSTDHTQDVLDHLSHDSSKLMVIKISSLPSGWLGKNHALWSGYKKSKGEWLLFTDADVHFQTDSMTKAIQFAIENNVDHLTVLPEFETGSIFEEAAMQCFLLLFTVYCRPWKVKDPKSRYAMGVGAFNLISRSAYEKLGTHQAFPLSVVDDLDLGRHVKKNGFKSDVVISKGQIRIRWQNGILGIFKGLEKNFFASLRFSRTAALLSFSFLLILTWLPPWGLLFGSSLGSILGGATLFFYFLTFLKMRRFQKSNFFVFLLLPFGTSLLAFSLLRSMIVTIKNKGIRWRDTFYPLSMFKKPTWRDVWKGLRGEY